MILIGFQRDTRLIRVSKELCDQELRGVRDQMHLGRGAVGSERDRAEHHLDHRAIDTRYILSCFTIGRFGMRDRFDGRVEYEHLALLRAVLIDLLKVSRESDIESHTHTMKR